MQWDKDSQDAVYIPWGFLGGDPHFQSWERFRDTVGNSWLLDYNLFTTGKHWTDNLRYKTPSTGGRIICNAETGSVLWSSLFAARIQHTVVIWLCFLRKLPSRILGRRRSTCFPKQSESNGRCQHQSWQRRKRSTTNRWTTILFTTTLSWTTTSSQEPS